MADRNPELRSAAQLVRRATLSNSQALVKSLASLSRAQAVDSLLARPLDTAKVPPFLLELKPKDIVTYKRTNKGKELQWWAQKAIFSTNPLQERMAFFFHTFLTSHQSSGGNIGVGNQIDLFRANSLGNFRTLLKGFLKNTTLIVYLNANTSTAKNPNENLARELMELFSLGVGNYSEADVRSAALGLSGWKTAYADKKGSNVTVDGTVIFQYRKAKAAQPAKDGKEAQKAEVATHRKEDDGTFVKDPKGIYVADLDGEGNHKPKIVFDQQTLISEYDPARGHQEAETFLGESKVWTLDSIADRVCDHPATHARITSLLWYHLAGVRLSKEKAKTEGSWWASQDLEMKPLIKRILNDPSLNETYYSRPRSGFEYYCAAFSAIGRKQEQVSTSDIKKLGQGLYEPPNVAGWPDDRWLLAESMLQRSNFAFGINKTNSTVLTTPETEDILDRCGLYEIGQTSLAAIADVEKSTLSDEEKTFLRWRVILNSPEFHLL